jgi:hypothetical protein
MTAPIGHRVTAWITLLALVVGLGMPMLPGFHVLAAAGDGCADAAGLSRERRIDTPGDSTQAADHCVMCHWLRTAHNASFGPVEPSDPPRAVEAAVTGAPADAASRLVVLERPSRAPPRA